MSGLVVWLLLFLVASLVFMFAPMIYGFYGEWKAAKERGEVAQFDERQRTLRRNAALHALVAVLIYLVVWAFLDLCSAFSWTKESFVIAMLAVVLAYGIWMGECIFRGVAYGWNMKPEQRAPHPVMVGPLCMIAAFMEDIRLTIVAVAVAVTVFVISILNVCVERRLRKLEKDVEMAVPCEEVDAP